jgi:hypothetical protein
MASQLIVVASYLAFLVMASAVVVTVDRRERYVFVGGVVLLLAGLALLRGSAGAAVAVLGVVAVVGAAVPLLREPAPST